MKTLMTFAAVAACTAVGLCAEVKTPDTTRKDMEAKRNSFVERTGGLVVKPGSHKGRVVLINKQKRVSEAEIKPVLGALFRDTRFNFELTVDSSAEGGVVVEIIDDETKPGFLVAPEDYWASVNVAKLGKGLATEDGVRKFLPSRLRKELMRAVAFACGCGASAYPGNLFDLTTTADLDFRLERYPVDVIKNVGRKLVSRGLAPTVVAPYNRAVHEGWAPAPTNDIQRAVYERVTKGMKEKPTKGIKITPETTPETIKK